MQPSSRSGVARAADGAEIVWQEAGVGEPILLISGQAVDATSWDAIVPSLSTRFRVLRYDHRGTGRSGAGSDASYSMRGFAADAVAVLDAAGARKAHIYGHSMGGRVAQWIAVDSASRVAGLVLGATTAGDARGVPRSAEASADLASGDPERFARLFFRSGEFRADAAAFFHQAAKTHARRLHFTASRDHDTWDRLQQITAPTLVLHGTDDEMTPPGNAERIAATIPGAELHLFKGARHGYYLEESDATARVIDFLQAHPIAE